MRKILITIQFLVILVFISGCALFEEELEDNHAPILSGDQSITLEIHSELPDWKTLITATDKEDGLITITDAMIDASDVDISTIGSYEVIYNVPDSQDLISTFILVVIVEASTTFQYAHGAYDLSSLNGESKAMIYNAMEDYLLENVIGGVPLYTNADYYMFSNRIDLFSSLYNPVFGFGHDFSSLKTDDSTVLMDQSTYGQIDEYTFRTTYKYSFESSMWNPYEDDFSSSMVDYIHGSLYNIKMDETKTGFRYAPELAKDMPKAIDGGIIDGDMHAKIWQITLKNDLKWNMHTDVSSQFSTDEYLELDATDFIWTWQKALQEEWFRAISGGNDFITSGILNAENYINGTITDIDQVGLRLANEKDNTIEIEFDESKSMDYVTFMFAQLDKSPLNQELYHFVDQHMTDSFGTTPQTIASSGPYIFDSVDENQTVSLKKNPDYVYSNEYNYTGIQLRLMDKNEAFSAFLAEELDFAAVPADEVENYLNDERMIGAANGTTLRLVINGFESIEAKDEFFNLSPVPENMRSWEPEPILQYIEMKQALYYGVNREDISHTYMPAYTYFSNHYIVDKDGTSIYGSNTRQALLSKYQYTDDFLNKARNLFHEALEKAISDGYYINEIENATQDNPFLIELELTYTDTQNDIFNAYIAALKTELEDSIFDDQLYVGVDIQLNNVAFPSSYTEYLLYAATDLGIASRDGMSYINDLNQYRDDYMEVPLNFGIDTSTANIEISYINQDNESVYEIWSYNAMCEALNGFTYVDQGMIQTSWEDTSSFIDAYAILNDITIVETTDGTEIAEVILNKRLYQYAYDEGFDELHAFVIKISNQDDILLLLSEAENGIEMFDTYELYLSAEDAIIDNISQYIDLYVKISQHALTDLEIDQHEYISMHYGYKGISDVAIDQKLSLEHTEVWSITWESWIDAYVLLHIDQYYVPWVWL